VACSGYAAQLAGSIVSIGAAGTNVTLLGVALFGAGFGNATSLIVQIEFVKFDVPRVVALIVGIAQGGLAAQLAAEVASEPHTRLRYQCSPYHRDSVLHPFVMALGRAARLAPDDPAQTQLDKLEAILAPARIAETAPLFASLLSIPTGDRDDGETSAAPQSCRCAREPRRRGTEGLQTPRWSKGDSNSPSHSERQLSNGRTHGSRAPLSGFGVALS
jgi:hypothetical protein